MSLASNKRKVFNTISSIKSFDKTKILNNNTLESITNKKNPLKFLIDLLVVLIGVGGLFIFIGKIFSVIFVNVKPKIHSAILNKYNTASSNKRISETNFNNGVIIKMSEIDINKKMKIKPNTNEGSLSYDVNDFDYLLYNIININNSGNINNINIEYDSNSDSILVKSLNDDILYDFYDEYINYDNNISKKTFVSTAIDSIFGVKNKNLNKNIEQIKNELIYKKKIENIINDVDGINDDDLSEIEFNANNLSKGVKYNDWCCGYYESTVDISDVIDLVDNIESDDEYTISNKFNVLFDKSYNSDNNDAAKDSFAKDVVNSVDVDLSTSYLLSIKFLILYKIKQKIENNTNNNIDEYIEENKDLIKCVSKNIKGVINEEMFKLVKKELNKIVIPFTKEIIKEKSNQYIAIIKSLISFS